MVIWRCIHLRWIQNAVRCIARLSENPLVFSHINLRCVPTEFWIIPQIWEWAWKCSVLCHRYFLRGRQLCWGSWTLFLRERQGAHPGVQKSQVCWGCSKEGVGSMSRNAMCHQTKQQQQRTGFLSQKTGFWEFSEMSEEISDSQNWKERSRNFEGWDFFCFLSPCTSAEWFNGLWKLRGWVLTI